MTLRYVSDTINWTMINCATTMVRWGLPRNVTWERQEYECYEWPTCEWVSEQILNGTSAHLGYTVPFKSVYGGKYGQKTNQETDIVLNLSTTQKTSKQHKTQQNKTIAWFSRLIRHSARKRGGLILERSRGQTGRHVMEREKRSNVTMTMMSCVEHLRGSSSATLVFCIDGHRWTGPRQLASVPGH